MLKGSSRSPGKPARKTIENLFSDPDTAEFIKLDAANPSVLSGKYNGQ